MNREPQPIFLVVRRTWNAGDDQGFSNDEERVPVRAFENKDAAEAHRLALEAEARREFDYLALWHGELGNYTQPLAAAIFRLGLPALEEGEYFSDWVSIHGEKLTEEQRLALHEAVPQCRVYEVVESWLVE